MLYKIKPVYCYFTIALFSFLVFLNTLGNDFVFDDESVVQNYEAIRNLSNIPKFFTAQEGFHKVIGNYYRPIVSTTYAIDYSIWDLTPKGFHLTNNLINLIASLFLFAILYSLFKKYKFGILASLIASLIFTAHPVHTEAVSWISGRTDSLVTLFFFAAFYFYVVYFDERDRKFLILSLVFYSFGLLSKEMIVTFPVIIILFDFMWKKRAIKEILGDWKIYAYYIGLTVIYLIVRYSLLHGVIERTKYNYFYDKDFITVLATMLKTIPVYLKLLIYPVGLLYHYNGVIPDSNTLLDRNVIFSIILIFALIILSIVLYKDYGKISFCILFIFVTLLPVMNIIPTMSFMAERFLYITSFSLPLLIAFLIAKYSNEKNKNAIISISLIIILALTFLTVKRNSEWKDNDTLYSTCEGIDGSVLLVNCGNIYANKKQFDEAEKRYRRAIEIRTNNVLAHHNIGLIYLLRGDLDSAEIKFKDGLAVDSLAPDGYFQLANVYQQEGKINEAVAQLEKLQTFAPNYRDSKSLIEMLKTGNIPQTPNITGDAQGQLNSKQIALLEKRSYNYYQQGKYKESIKDIEEMVKLNLPGKSGYLNNIAMCYQGMGDTEKAIEYFSEAFKINSQNINALAGIADCYRIRGDKNKAIEYYKKVLILNPTDEIVKKKIDSLKAN
jgi:protein O-mannosyl-transferase